MKTGEKINAVLIDDESNCLNLLEWELQNVCPHVAVVAKCTSGKEGLKAIHSYKPDVVFLDIEMPYMSGFEMLESLPEINFKVIFTTAYDQYALKAFKLNAIDYILKPVAEEELIRAVSKIIAVPMGQESNRMKLLLASLQGMQNAGSSNIENIALPTLDGLIFINKKEIVYCQSDNSYTKIFTKEKKKLLISRTLKEMEERLNGGQFFRVHNSFVVNLNEIQKYVKSDGGYLIMTNGGKVKVSRSKKDELLDFF